jgi:hypothetical protein
MALAAKVSIGWKSVNLPNAAISVPITSEAGVGFFEVTLGPDVDINNYS